MNKQELIEKLEARHVGDLVVSGSFKRGFNTMKGIAVDLASKLDEPEPIVVPQFVADWYEVNKANLEYNLWHYIRQWQKQEDSEFKEWMDYASNKPIETLIRMKDGYTVKEPKWVVRNNGGNYFEKFTGYQLGRAWSPQPMDAMVFTDQAKADAVAAIVEGKVEEV